MERKLPPFVVRYDGSIYTVQHLVDPSVEGPIVLLVPLLDVHGGDGELMALNCCALDPDDFWHLDQVVPVYDLNEARDLSGRLWAVVLRQVTLARLDMTVPAKEAPAA